MKFLCEALAISAALAAPINASAICPPISLSGHHKLIVHAVVAIFIFIIHFRVIPRLGIDGQSIALQIHISHFTSNVQGIAQTPLCNVETNRIDNRVVAAGKDILFITCFIDIGRV